MPNGKLQKSEGGGAATAATALRSVPAIDGYDVMGLSADAMESMLRRHEPQLVGAARARRALALLRLAYDAPPPSPPPRAPHGARLRALTLADAIGYDLWTVTPQISKGYATVRNGDCPSLVEILLGDAQHSAGLAPADAARGARATANCFLSWHMAAPLLELLEAQRAKQAKDGAEPI
jgi:hypothetical protein